MKGRSLQRTGNCHNTGIRPEREQKPRLSSGRLSLAPHESTIGVNALPQPFHYANPAIISVIACCRRVSPGLRKLPWQIHVDRHDYCNSAIIGRYT